MAAYPRKGKRLGRAAAGASVRISPRSGASTPAAPAGAGSPAIDAGKSGSDFCNEPEPNGGAANLGAYGNTDEATSKIGSAHEPCDD